MLHYLKRFKAKIWLFVSMAVCLTFIFSTGPQLQTYFMSLLNSDVPSIYASVYQQDLISFPTLGTWLGAVFDIWSMSLVALCVSYVALNQRTPRAIAWHIAWSSAVALMAADAIGALIWDQVNVKWLAENLFANTLGGAMTAALMVAIFTAVDAAYEHSPLDSSKERWFGGFLTCVCGLLYCCMAYYLGALFFAPLPTAFDMTLTAPASGAISAETENVKATTGAAKPKSFSFAPDSMLSVNTGWSTPKGDIVIDGKAESSQPIRVELRLVTGCVSAAAAAKLQPSGEAWISQDLPFFRLLGGSGVTDFLTTSNEGDKVQVKLNTGAASFFHLSEETAQINYASHNS